MKQNVYQTLQKHDIYLEYNIIVKHKKWLNILQCLIVIVFNIQKKQTTIFKSIWFYWIQLLHRPHPQTNRTSSKKIKFKSFYFDYNKIIF